MQNTRQLMSLELEYLRNVERSGPVTARLYVCWVDGEGETQMGPLRYAMGKLDGEVEYYSVSPFPGAWVSVPESAIQRVRHLQAMSLCGAEAK